MVKEIKKIIARSCIYFTIVEFILLLIAPYVMKTVINSIGESNFLTLKSAALIYLTLFLLSAFDLIFKIPRISSAILRVFHFILCLLASLIPIVFVPKNTPSQIILICIVFISVIYIVLSLVSYLIKLIINNKQDREYKNIVE